MPDEEAAERPIALLVFRVADHCCAIPASEVQEVLPMMAMLRPPGKPPIVEGFLNIRGRAVPAISLRRLFRLTAAGVGLYTPLVLTTVQEQVLACIVDAVEDVTAISQSQLQPVTPDHILNDAAQAWFESDSGSVTLLSSERLLLLEERHVLSELASSLGQRIAELGASGV